MSEKSNEIQPVLRALQVLEALNTASPMPLATLHAATALPKPTLVRLLETLIAGGYVQRVSRRAGYGLGERVLRLSGGFRHSDEVVEASRPFLSSLTAQFKWPVAVATPDGDAMTVRLSTRRESPFASDQDYLGRRVPMLISALGRVYLAFCPQDEREALLDLMRGSKARRNAMARDGRAVSRLLEGIRARGYASAAPLAGEPLQGFAVPVMVGGRPLAAITLRYYVSAMTEEEAARRYFAAMEDAAKAIAGSIG